MDLHPSVIIAHQSPGRLRIKVPHRRNDHGFFVAARQKLLAFQGIDAIVVTPLTASVLIKHDGKLDIEAVTNVLTTLARENPESLPHTSAPALDVSSGPETDWSISSLLVQRMMSAAMKQLTPVLTKMVVRAMVRRAILGRWSGYAMA